MFSFPSFGEFVAMFLVFAAVFASLIGVVLKLCGVLILSWGWVLAPIGISVLLIVFSAVVLHLFRD